MDSHFLNSSDEDESENMWAGQKPLHKIRLAQTMRSLNLPWRRANKEMPPGLRDEQIMVDASRVREQERESARQFDRVMMALSRRFSNISLGSPQQPSPSRGWHRLLHRRQ